MVQKFPHFSTRPMPREMWPSTSGITPRMGQSALSAQEPNELMPLFDFAALHLQPPHLTQELANLRPGQRVWVGMRSDPTTGGELLLVEITSCPRGNYSHDYCGTVVAPPKQPSLAQSIQVNDTLTFQMRHIGSLARDDGADTSILETIFTFDGVRLGECNRRQLTAEAERIRRAGERKRAQEAVLTMYANTKATEGPSQN